MRLYNSLGAALAVLAPVRATPVDTEVSLANDPNKPGNIGFTPMEKPDVIQGPPDYPPSVARKFKRYVALGDSYSAGPGATATHFGTKPGNSPPYASDCYQTDGGWPVQLKSALDPDMQFQFSACTGWTSKQIREGEVLDPASNFNGKDNDWPDLVSITMGGNNDNAFLNVIKACSLAITIFIDCQDALAAAQKTIDGIETEFSDTMTAIMEQGRDGWRTLVVMGYPILYNQDTTDVWNCRMNPDERKSVNDLVSNVNGVLKKVADATHATYSKKPPNKGGGDVVFADPNSAYKTAKDASNIPTTRQFDTHRFCEENNTAYFNGGAAPPLNSTDITVWLTDYYKGLFHPDANGMRVMADAALIALSGLSEKVPTGDSDTADAGNKSTKAPASAACQLPTYDDDDTPEGPGEVHEYTGGDIEQRTPTRTVPVDLYERGLDQSAKLSFKPSGVPEFNIIPATYPHFDKVGLAKGWFSPKFPGQCGVGETDIAYGRIKPSGFDKWATEHVFEKQCLRNYIQAMTFGKLLSGGNLGAGAAHVQGIFNEDGAFFKPWPNDIKPSWGAAPVDSAFGVLGHDGPGPDDDGNLMVLEGEVNRVKGVISGRKNFVSDKSWKGFANDGEKKWEEYAATITTGAMVMRYMQNRAVIGAYNHAFVHLREFWKTFAKHPAAQKDYDYEGAFVELVKDDLQLQVSTHHGNWKARINDVVEQAGPNPDPGSKQFIYGSLMSPFLDQMDDIMKFDIDAMTALGDDGGDPMDIDTPGISNQDNAQGPA